jgi:hypothetical protein
MTMYCLLSAVLQRGSRTLFMFLIPVTKVELSWEVPSESHINGMFQEYLLVVLVGLFLQPLGYHLNTRMLRQVSLAGPYLFRQI